MPRTPPDIRPEIAQGDLSAELLSSFLGSREIAIDTETMGLNPIRDRLCLVQLCNREGRAALVQIPRHEASSPREGWAPRLKRLLEDPGILKVFHFARFDVATLSHYLGIKALPLYCTRTASKLVRTYTDRHGLKDLCLELLDVEMDKAARHTDWSTPNLSPEQIRYAISDVTLLIPLMDRLESMLERERKKQLARACFEVIPTLSTLDLMGYEDVFIH